jgi:hypothetical protein
MIDPPISSRDLLFTLLLKVGVAASFAALLARWNTFRRVLFTEERDPDQKLKLMLFMTPPLIVGVVLRLVGAPYRFADLSLEGAFLMGLLGGRVVGPIGGAIITIPSLMAHEWLGMPGAATAGLVGGLIRQIIPTKEDLWNFGPFTFLNIPRDLVRLAIAASVGLRWPGAWPRSAGEDDDAEVAVRHRPALELVADFVRAGDGYGCGRAPEDLEQHAYRDEPRAAPTVAIESANGCTLEPDQSTLFVQHTEYRFVADSRGPGSGPRRRSQTQ